MIRCKVKQRHMLRKGVKVIYKDYLEAGDRSTYYTWMPADSKYKQPYWMVTINGNTSFHHNRAWMEDATIAVLNGETFAGYVLYKE